MMIRMLAFVVVFVVAFVMAVDCKTWAAVPVLLQNSELNFEHRVVASTY